MSITSINFKKFSEVKPTGDRALFIFHPSGHFVGDFNVKEKYIIPNDMGIDDLIYWPEIIENELEWEYLDNLTSK